MHAISKRQMANNNYVLFENTFDTYENKNEITRQDFKFIINTFFHLLQQDMMLTGRIYFLPKSLGNLGIRKFKNKHKILDYQHYRATGEKVFVRNTHSEGFAVKIDWHQYYLKRLDTAACVFRLTPARLYARMIAKHIIDNNAISTYYDK